MAENFRIIKGITTRIERVQDRGNTVVQCLLGECAVNISTPQPPIINEGDYILKKYGDSF